MPKEAKCAACGQYIDGQDNFCRFCGTKQKEVCKCWIKKQPYNCGQDKCPGYRLFGIEKSLKTKL